MGGKVVSVTTDGFITDVASLESKLLKLKEAKTPLFRLFKALRVLLTDDSTTEALELKNQSKGLISWSTRGQLGLEKGIKATAGFQSYGYSNDEMVKIFKDILSKEEKMFEFTQKSTRSAKDVFNRGGHVISIYKDQKVRLIYDNRRVIQTPKDFTGFDMSNRLFDSNPHENIISCSKARYLSKFSINLPYLKSTAVKSHTKALYKTALEVGVRSFIKGYLAETPCFGLTGKEFNGYSEIINFISEFDKAKVVKLSRQSISNLKARQAIIRSVPRTRETKAFAAYIKRQLPHFCVGLFLKD